MLGLKLTPIYNNFTVKDTII